MSIETLLQWKAGIIIVWFLAVFVLERTFVAANAPSSNARLWRNGALWLSVTLLSPFIIVPIAAWGANHLLWERPPGMHGWSILIDFLILDLWTYWVHRAYHVVPPMWRLHRVHHLDEFLDTTSAVRFHFGEVLLSAALRLIPIMAFAIPLSSIIVFEIILLSSAIFHHSNIRLPAKFEARLSRLIVTPSIHWVHHHAIRADTDSNYAGVLSVWDRLFGSKSPTGRSLSMKIGVEEIGDASFFRLLLSPFKKRF